MIKLYMARHGETDLNIKKVYYGWLDVALNKNGINQCESLRESLAHINFDLVISSTLSRAIDSAKLVSGNSFENINGLEDLKEINFGKWEGLHYKEIERIDEEAWKNWSLDWKNFTIPSGENFLGFYKRVENCLGEIISENDNKTILLVAHEGTLKVIATILLKMPKENYWDFTFEFGKFSMFEIQGERVIIRKINC